MTEREKIVSAIADKIQVSLKQLCADEEMYKEVVDQLITRCL